MAESQMLSSFQPLNMLNLLIINQRFQHMKKGKIKIILEDHQHGFLKIYENKIRSNVKKEVEKVLKCKDTKYGFIELKCDKCNTKKKIGFTCKSRFCTSCGKIYTDNWIDNMLGNLIIVTVIHTFGRDLKWNPHVHMMVTEGGKGNITEWRHIRHISYESLRKRWQKILLDEITNISGNTKEVKLIKNKLYKEKVKGFYVHAKTEIKSAKIAAKYVGRYVGRPAIAESRILKYDGKNVTYKYTRHEDNKVIVETVHVYEFIKRIIRHIPEKNFKMIRYFGIYSRRSKGKVNFIKMIDKRILSIRKSIANWENRILAIAGVDPCKCPNCKNKMSFHDIVYPKYGSMRERLRIKIISENEDKLEEILENYAITKRILGGKIIPKTTQFEEIK